MYGKKTVIKTFLQSQLVYSFSVLPSPTQTFFKKVEKLIFKYLWDNKPDRIKRDVLYSDRQNGGLSIPNVEYQDCSIKISWVKRLLTKSENEDNWYKLVKSQLPPGCLTVFEGNMNESDLKGCGVLSQSKFWQSVLVSWFKMSYNRPENREEILNQSLWYNSFIKCKSKVLFYQGWQNAGVNYIKDIVDENGKFLPYQIFEQKYGTVTNYVEYYGVTSAIEQEWKSKIRSRQRIAQVGEYCDLNRSRVEWVRNSNHITQDVYNKLRKTFAHFPSHLVDKWRAELNNGEIDNDFISNSLGKLYAASISTKIRQFQYRLINRIIVTNVHLYKWRKKENSLCELCQEEEESYKHLFADCKHVRPYWEKVCNWIAQKTGLYLQLNRTEILLGTPDYIHPLIDLLYTIGKMHIYNNRFKNVVPDIKGYTRTVYDIENMEKYIAKKIMTHRKKWLFAQERSANALLGNV